MGKKRRLQKITEEIKNCKICKIGKIGKAVPGEGNPDAKVMFVGEAPGKLEVETGRPFVGRSGKLLRSLIKEIGLKEEEVYITSPVKYLPLSGKPSPSDIEHGRIHLLRQIEIIDPKMIVLLGSVAAQAVLPSRIQVVKRHGEVAESSSSMDSTSSPHASSESSRKVFITFHPSYILRFQRDLPIYKEDFKKLKKLIDETDR